MDSTTVANAIAVISRFLLPRVRAYVQCKSRSPAYRDYYSSDLALLSPCSVCYEPTFGGHWCLECRDARKADPEKFARDNLLCKHCFFPDGPEGCVDMCPESRVGPCHACGKEVYGDEDWAWTGHCSRACARSYQDRGRWD